MATEDQSQGLLAESLWGADLDETDWKIRCVNEWIVDYVYDYGDTALIKAFGDLRPTASAAAPFLEQRRLAFMVVHATQAIKDECNASPDVDGVHSIVPQFEKLADLLEALIEDVAQRRPRDLSALLTLYRELQLARVCFSFDIEKGKQIRMMAAVNKTFRKDQSFKRSSLNGLLERRARKVLEEHKAHCSESRKDMLESKTAWATSTNQWRKRLGLVVELCGALIDHVETTFKRGLPAPKLKELFVHAGMN